MDRCRDYSSDGIADNGLINKASFINNVLSQGFNDIEMKLVLELGNSDQFPPSPTSLSILFGRLSSTSELTLDTVSYDPASCLPINVFHDALIENGHLVAGPSELLFPLPDGSGLFSFDSVFLESDVSLEELGGVDYQLGVVTGVLGYNSMEVLVSYLEDALCESSTDCTVFPWRDWPEMLDLDQDSDGKNDALSLCLLFQGIGGTVLSVEEPQ